ncbi:MAG: dihydroneopterin triphosphate diphosphatase [Gammaproteobacteria bacterium]
MNAAHYKRPESVLVVVYTRHGDVLMLQRVQPPDFWQSVTGSLRWGESAADAACRELSEETGLQSADRLVDCQRRNTFPIVPPWRDRYAPGVDTNTEHVFKIELPCRPAIRLSPREHSDLRWLPRAAAARLASSYTNREAILQCVPSG